MPLLLWSLLGMAGWPEAYRDELHAAGRAPFWLLEIDQPRCALTMGTAPCTASIAGGDGTFCYYTFHTCQDRENVDLSLVRTLYFLSSDVAIPPYVIHDPGVGGVRRIHHTLSKVSHIAQDIDVEAAMTRTDKLSLSLLDEGGDDDLLVFDSDKPVRNTSRAGSYWRRLLAQWPNFRNAEVRLKRGFHTATFRLEDCVTLWRGKLDAIRFDEKGMVHLSCVDLLRAVEKTLPPKISGTNTVQTTISRSATSMVVDDASRFTDPAVVTGGVYVTATNADTGRTEKMRVTARDVGTDTLTITRAQFGTVADPHHEGEEVREIVVERAADGVGGLHPITIALDLLNRVGIPDADIDTGSFYREGAWAAGMRFGREMDEPVEARKLLFELGELMAFGNFFVDEALRVRLAMMAAPAAPDATVHDVTDSPNVLFGSGSANVNEKEARLTHCSVFFDKKSDATAAVSSGDVGPTSTADYASIVLAVNGETFTEDYYGAGEEDRREKKIKDAGAWILPGDFPQAQITAVRWVNKNAHAPVLFSYKAELRDDVMLIGDAVDAATDDIQDVHGATKVTRCRVVKKAHDSDGHGFAATLRAIGGEVLDANGLTKTLRYAVAGPSTMASTYGAATDADKLYGYLGDADGLVDAGAEDGYALW